MIGVFDSGIGGLTILEELKKVLPDEEFEYFADSKNNPYGEKSDAELFNITQKICENFISRGAKIIVIACNTATTRCIDFLRATFSDTIFVGTEPAVKLACDSGYNNILILATPGTVESSRLEQLIVDNKKPNQNISTLACPGLAHAIETKNSQLISELLDKFFHNLDTDSFDAVVLGCTHYPLIIGELKKYFKKAAFIDGRKAVAKRVLELARPAGIEPALYP